MRLFSLEEKTVNINAKTSTKPPQIFKNTLDCTDVDHYRKAVNISIPYSPKDDPIISDVVARLGGDEFAILLLDGVSAGETDDLVERIRKAVEAPIGFDDLMLRVTASIGVAHYVDDGRSREDMMQQADARMYKDKQRVSGDDLAQTCVA